MSDDWPHENASRLVSGSPAPEVKESPSATYRSSPRTARPSWHPARPGTANNSAATSPLVTTALKVRRSVVEGGQDEVGDRALAAREGVVLHGHPGDGRAAVDPGLVPGADVVARAGTQHIDVRHVC